jgi:lichenan operon transcriptional antiterminator
LYDDIFGIASDKEVKEGLERVENKADFITFTREKGVF